MTELTSQTTFNILTPQEAFEEEVDLNLFPENDGIDAVRELRYPGNKYPPVQYESNPDKWDNFDSAPMTNRPQVKAEMTISSVQVVHWRGYIPDKPVREIWPGSDTQSRMTAYFLRRLYEYYIDPPTDEFITWWPKDRTEEGYNIRIESLTVGGTDVVTFMNAAIRHDIIPWEVVFTFRIIEAII